MVDALGEVHRVLAPGGILVDARPDSRVPAYVELRKPRGFQRFGLVRTSRPEVANDRASDLAIARVVRDGLFKRRRPERDAPGRAVVAIEGGSSMYCQSPPRASTEESTVRSAGAP